MATSKGYIKNLHISRSLGKFTMDETDITGSITINIFNDAPESLIDPTEMVRRNWLISQLQKALSDGLAVTVEHLNDFVEAVALEGQHAESEGNTNKVRGTVTAIELGANFGLVTVKILLAKIPGQSATHRPTPDVFKEEVFSIYQTKSYAVNMQEFWRRFHIITLLQQSLNQGLEVTVTHLPPAGNLLSFGRILQVGIALKT